MNGRQCSSNIQVQFFNSTLTCLQAPIEDANEKEKDKFYLVLKDTYNKSPDYDIKIAVGGFNAKIGKEIHYRPTIGRNSIHLESNNNSRRMIDSKVCKGMNVSSSFFSDKKIHKYTRRAPDRATSNETDHFLINSRYGSSVMNVQNSRSADIDADHFLVMMKYRQCIVILKIIKNPKSQ
ncbi:hypothetical protein CWI37_0361p0030 [Hamiltosporidium tvaerminnensis]|uniref:Endonuclease/exonuclease/phosphatase domain-containing protein n=2 Tax=Hamiltosporidium TaxID=1176354 RepID=A0A4Q9LN08_9MICR|nr:hypothetical protein CWI37_0361p0030 [Hamiltosporidium tvaerminnensis]TBU03318.1 hypothetical protein CWI39_0988p0010 [Hamiltosporidium magnivora]TBU08097.1 hypothetical protein CWI39_0226p0020 [Hamiltosporidium magnivora]TBU08851.1 hypothetical protein CWI36_0091p0020 [Hamiltosporidium magnivora]